MKEMWNKKIVFYFALKWNNLACLAFEIQPFIGALILTTDITGKQTNISSTKLAKSTSLFS